MTQKGLIFHMRFPTQYLLAATLLRFQEYYESPKFAGTIFDLEAYMDWYAERYGNFTYTSDWNGFNLPSTAFDPFISRKFNPLSRKELALLKTLGNRFMAEKACHGKFYFIATHGESSDVEALSHEIVHGLYSTNSNYAQKVQAVIYNFPKEAKVFAKLLDKAGYNQSVWDDETNAYAVTGLCDSWKPKADILEPLCLALQKLFHDTFGIDPTSPQSEKEMRQFITEVPYSEFEKHL